jgi:hypothetical protein
MLLELRRDIQHRRERLRMRRHPVSAALLLVGLVVLSMLGVRRSQG